MMRGTFWPSSPSANVNSASCRVFSVALCSRDFRKYFADGVSILKLFAETFAATKAEICANGVNSGWDFERLLGSNSFIQNLITDFTDCFPVEQRLKHARSSDTIQRTRRSRIYDLKHERFDVVIDQATHRIRQRRRHRVAPDVQPLRGNRHLRSIRPGIANAEQLSVSIDVRRSESTRPLERVDHYSETRPRHRLVRLVNKLKRQTLVVPDLATDLSIRAF